MAVREQMYPPGFGTLLALAQTLFPWVPLQHLHWPLPLGLVRAPLQRDAACVPSLLLGRTLLHGMSLFPKALVQGGHIHAGNLPRERVLLNARDPMLCPSRASHFRLLPFLNPGGKGARPRAMRTG